MNAQNQSRRADMAAFSEQVRRSGRNDGSNGVFTEEATTAILSEVFRKKYEGFKFVGGGLMPMDTSAGAGALAVAWDDVGASAGGDGFVADNVTDISTVDVNLERRSNPVHTIARAYTYSDQEMATALMGNYDPIVDKGLRTREQWERDLNNAIRFGVPALNLPGFFRNPSLQPVSALTGAWASASADDIILDFAEAISAIRTNTAGVGEPDTVIFDLPTWNILEAKQKSVASDKNVLQWLMSNYKSITTWAWDFGLRGQGDGGTGEGAGYTGGSNVLMMYKNDRQILRSLLPRAITPKGPQEKDLSHKVIFWGRYAGLAMPRPKEVVRLEGL